MKELICKTTLASILICLSSFNILANDNRDYTKEIHEEYDFVSNGRISIENKFGEVRIETWDEDRVVVDVIVTVDSDSERLADDIFDEIQIDFDLDDDYLSIVTEFENDDRRNWDFWDYVEEIIDFSQIYNRRSVEFSVDYRLSIPKTTKLDIENSFGDCIVEEIDNDVKIFIKHGDLTCENISKELDLKIQHGQATLDEVQELDLESSNAEIKLRSAKTVNIETRHSNFDLGTIGTMRSESSHDDFRIDEVGEFRNTGRYDDFEINKVDDFRISSRYTDVRLINLENSGDIEIESGEFELKDLDQNFDQLDLDVKNTKVYLNMDSETSYRFDFTGESTRVDIPSNLILNNEEEFDEEIRLEGYNRSASGSGKIEIRMKHGSLRIR